MSHDPDLGTWQDTTQTACCRRCRRRLPIAEWEHDCPGEEMVC